MKRTLKKCISLLLAAVMMFGVAPLGLFALKTQAADTTYQNGDIIEFGSYPQSEVKDSALLAELNKLSKTWISYGYYIGTGSREDGQMTAKDYMKYADVTYNGNKYRAVTFSSYRPSSTKDTATSYTSFQDDNGYTINNVYWFKYEPLKWRVLDSTGLVICETIIDSQPYNNYILYTGSEWYGNSSKTYYANNYANSSIREWLNDDFYNTAFTSSEKDVIKTTTLHNSAYDSSYSKYDSVSTNDKVFLLSYSDAGNTNYFENDTARKASGSDYAKCQGLYVFDSELSFWRLRSAGNYYYYSCYVSPDGYVNYNFTYTYETDRGVRPSLTLDFMNISDPDINDPDNNDPDNNDPDNNDPDNNDPDNNDPDNNDPDNNDPDTITEPTGISIKNPPAKTEYIYKQDKLDVSGIELLVTYSDGTTETVTDTSEMTFSGFSNEKRGEQTVTVEYEGLQASFKVTVKYVWWQWIIVILLFGWIWF